MNERDRKAADDWMREHTPDPDEYSHEDSEEAGCTEHYFFLRISTGALAEEIREWEHAER